MEAIDDAELLERIARQQNREAFETLYSRHEKHAYSLAYYLTGNHELARDAVQEAMLGVWLSASSYQRGRGAAPGWILRIVANKSIKLAHKKRGNEVRMNDDHVEDVDAQNTLLSDSTEQKELRSALRDLLERLPIVDRRLVGLYYSAGLTQEEIAHEVDMPVRTVAFRIQKALEMLRANLARAGFASIPILGANVIGEAIYSCCEAPAGMRETVLSKIAAAGGKATQTLSQRVKSVSRRASAAKFGGAGIVVLIGVALLGLWSLSGNTKKAATATPEPQIQALSPAPAPEPAPYSRKWDFNTAGQVSDFKVFNGSWHWVPNGGPDGSGCMETEGDSCDICLDIPLDKLPIVWTMNISARPQGGHTQILRSPAGWDRCFGGFAEFLNLAPLHPIMGNSWNKQINYFTATYVDLWRDNERVGLLVTKPLPSARIELSVTGVYRLDDIEIRQIRPGDLPDASAFLSAYEQIESSKRNGTVPVPQLHSNRPPAPVAIKFHTASSDDKTK